MFVLHVLSRLGLEASNAVPVILHSPRMKNNGAAEERQLVDVAEEYVHT